MRFSPGTVANSLAWAAILGLAAFARADRHSSGPIRLDRFGASDPVVCTRFSRDEDAPLGSTEAFRARMLASRSPEERAAPDAARVEAMSPLRFYRCGVALLVAGIAGFVSQRWH
jgi:hypothetical protein